MIDKWTKRILKIATILVFAGLALTILHEKMGAGDLRTVLTAFHLPVSSPEATPAAPTPAIPDGYAPKPEANVDFKQALATADLKAVTEAVAAELARQNFVAKELKRQPEIVPTALIAWGRSQQGDVPEVKTDAPSPAEVAKAQNAQEGVIVGNPDATFTVVEFIDPNCPHCREGIPALLKFVDGTPGVRLLFRELPVIAPQSAEAAKVAIALGEQGLYRDWLTAISTWKGGAIDGDEARMIAKGLGADMKKIDETAKSARTAAAIASSLSIGAAINIDGTPASIIGTKLVIGTASSMWLSDFVAQNGGPMPAKPTTDTPPAAQLDVNPAAPTASPVNLDKTPKN